MTAFYLGLPNNHGSLPATAQQLFDAGQIAGVMISASALWDAKGRRFRELAPQFDDLHVFLDSAGFVAAARWKGYPWTPEDYVAHVATMTHAPVAWSSMDLCCEPEVAPYRSEVRARVEETARLLARCRRLAAAHLGADRAMRQSLGLTGEWARPANPMPILQGWEPDDYLYSAEITDTVLDGVWPDLVGVGSVCRRRLSGSDGLIAILSRLDAELPPHVGLHLFGVHADARAELAHYPRVVSVDSQAWGQDSRHAARSARAAVESEIGETITPEHPAWVGDTLPGKVAAINAFTTAQQVEPRQTSLLAVLEACRAI